MKLNYQDITRQSKQISGKSSRVLTEEEVKPAPLTHKSQQKQNKSYTQQSQKQLQKKQCQHNQHQLTKSRIQILSYSNNNYYNIHPCNACGIDFNTNASNNSGLSSSQSSSNYINDQNYPSTNNHNSYSNSQMSSVVAHCQQVHAMELEFQSVVRGYQIRLKNVNEEHKRSKQQMETKIRQLFKQKTYWSNIANTLIQQNNRMGIQTPNLVLIRSTSTAYDTNMGNSSNHQSRNQSPVTTKRQKNPSMTSSFTLETPQQNLSNQNLGYQTSQFSTTSHTDRVLLSQFSKMRRKVQEIQKQNTKIIAQKQQVLKNIDKINKQSHGFKVKVNQYLKLIYKLQETQHSQQQQLIKIKKQLAFYQNQYNRIKLNINPTQSSTKSLKKRNPQPSRTFQRNPVASNNFVDINSSINLYVNQVQALKMTNQKYRVLISNLTEDKILSNLSKLNQKYSQNYAGSYGVSRGYSSNYSSMTASLGGDPNRSRKSSPHKINNS